MRSVLMRSASGSIAATPESSQRCLGSLFANPGSHRGQLCGQLIGQPVLRVAGEAHRLPRILAGATDGVGGEVNEFGRVLVGGSSAGLVDGHQCVLTLVFLWQQRCEQAGTVDSE